MKVNQAYRFELGPNNRQETNLQKHAGTARFTYNWGLARRIEEYEKDGRSSNAIEQHKQLNTLKKTEFPGMYEVSKCAAQESLRNLDRAYHPFFRRVQAGKKLGFPKFKKKGVNDSFRLTGAIRVFEKAGKLPKLGKISLKEKTGKFKGRILSATITREADRWYVSLQVERERRDPEPVQGKPVGIDIGLESFATLSDGTKEENPRFLKKSLKQLRKRSRSLSKKQKGSKNREIDDNSRGTAH